VDPRGAKHRGGSGEGWIASGPTSQRGSLRARETSVVAGPKLSWRPPAMTPPGPRGSGHLIYPSPRPSGSMARSDMTDVRRRREGLTLSGARPVRKTSPKLLRQSFPFTCGPAALGSVLSCLGWSPAPEWSLAETDIWRESTAIACPGAHPFGLALAAQKRGFAASVTWEGPRPWLWSHIHGTHHLIPRAQYHRIEVGWSASLRDAGILVRRHGPPRESNGLLLVESRDSPREERPDPHWIGLVSRPDGLWILDPLSRSPRFSRETILARWRRSGFQGSRTWIGLWGPEDPPWRERTRGRTG
jgi:hypothetical protein